MSWDLSAKSYQGQLLHEHRADNHPFGYTELVNKVKTNAGVE